MYCAGGVCGLVLEAEDRQHCPEPCNTFTKCSSCLRHAHCGWCAAPGISGEGICTEGSNERPMSGTCNDAYLETYRKPLEDEIVLDLTNITYTWNYVKCPAENECINGHHSCANQSEICVDLEVGFECQCGNGYKAGPNGCDPVCPSGKLFYSYRKECTG